MSIHRPKGPNGAWKTGQRVPVTGYYTDQFGVVTRHEAHDTFPPCVGRKGQVAFRSLITEVRVSA